MPTTDTIIDDMLIGYLACAVWAGLDWPEDDGNPDPLDKRYSVDDITDEARAIMQADIAAFVEANRDDLDRYAELRGFDPSQGTVWEYAGHDFYLNRNRHGAGFWDRGNDPVFERLSQASKVYGSQELYAIDGKLEVE